MFSLWSEGVISAKGFILSHGIITLLCTGGCCFAFPVQFEGTREEGEGADCIKTIMLFSDGGTEWPKEVLKQLVWNFLSFSFSLF